MTLKQWAWLGQDSIGKIPESLRDHFSYISLRLVEKAKNGKTMMSSNLALHNFLMISTFALGTVVYRENVKVFCHGRTLL